jgi:hypothetical protein
VNNHKVYLLIAGGRDFNNYEVLKTCVNAELKDNKLPVVVISGTAKGADSLGEEWAAENNFEVIQYKPDWANQGKAAGPLRNIEMYNFIKDKAHKKVIVFWNGLSKGTMHMIRISKNGGLPVKIFDYEGKLL